MPKLPSFGGKTRISTQVQRDQTIDPRSARRTSDAEARVFDEVTGLGNQLIQMRTKAQSNEDRANYKKVMDENKTRVSEDLEREFEEAGGDYTGYAEERSKRLKTASDSALGNISNPLTREGLKNSATAALSDDGVRSSSFENTKKAEFNMNQAQDRRDIDMSQLFDNASFDGASKTYDEEVIFRDESRGILYTDKAIQNLEKNDAYYGTSSLDGMLKNGNTAGVMRIVDGKGLTESESRLRSKIPPRTLKAYGASASRKRSSLTDQYQVSALRDAKDATKLARAKNFEYFDYDNQKRFTDIYESLSAVQDPRKRERAQAELKGAMLGAQAKAVIANELPAEELTDEKMRSSIESSIPPNSIVQSLAAEDAFGVWKKAAEHEKKMLSSGKGPEYFVENDQTLEKLSHEAVESPEKWNEYQASLENKYNFKKTSDSFRSQVPPSFHKVYGKGIKKALNEKDGDMAAHLFGKLEDVTGNDSYSVIQELGLPEDYAIIGNVDNIDRKRAVDLILNEDIDDESFKSKFNVSSHNLRVFKSKLREDPRFEAFADMGGMSNDASRRNAEAMLDLAFKNYKLHRQNTEDDKSALNKAWDLFDKNKVFKDNRSTLLLPQGATENDISNISRFSKITTTDAESSEIKPSQFFGAQSGIDFSGSEDGFNESVRKTGKWRTSLDGKSMELWAKNDRNLMKKAFSVSFEEASKLGADAPEEILWYDPRTRSKAIRGLERGAKKVREGESSYLENIRRQHSEKKPELFNPFGKNIGGE